MSSKMADALRDLADQIDIGNDAIFLTDHIRQLKPGFMEIELRFTVFPDRGFRDVDIEPPREIGTGRSIEPTPQWVAEVVLET